MKNSVQYSAIGGIVVDDEHPEIQRAGVRHLTVTLSATPDEIPKRAVNSNALPLPGSLSSQCRRPSCDMRDDIASPSPVPPYLPRRRSIGLRERVEHRARW